MVLVLALGVVLLDAPPFLPGVASTTGRADNASFNFPIRVEAARQWREGRLPLWNPYQFGGFPLLGDITSGVLYPGNLPFLISTSGSRYGALDRVAWLHFVLAGLSMYVFARAVSLGRSASALAGLVYGGNGFFLYLASHWIQAQNAAAWLPLILAAVKLSSLPGRFWRWSAIGAAAIALQILSGYPQYVFYTGLLAGVFALVVARDGAHLRPLVALVSMYVLGAALSAVQLMPATELAALSRRGGGVSLEEFLELASTPSVLRGLLIPGVAVKVSAPLFVMGGTFVGTLAAVLAVEGARTTRRIPLFLAGTLIVTLLLALGPATPIGELAYRIPGLNAFRYPFKHLLEVMFCVAALAGFGAQSVLDGRRGARTCVVCGALVAATWVVLFIGRLSFHWGLAVAIGGAIAFAVLVGLDRRPLAIAVALVSVWLGLAGNRAAVFVFQPAQAFDPPPTVQTLLGRTQTILGPRFTAGALLLDATVDPSRMLGLDYATEFRLPSVNGTSPFGWPPFLTALGLSENGTFVRPRYLTAATDQALDVLGVRYLVSNGRLIDGPVLQDDPKAIVTERPRALPALRFVDQVLCVDAAATHKELHRKRYDFASVAFIDCETMPPPAAVSPASPRSRIALLRAEPGFIQLRTRVPGAAPAMMVVSQADVPGWRARIDGRSAPIYRAYGIVQGIVVPPGQHEVELEYRPRSFVVGAFVSLGALVVLLGIGVLAARERREGVT